MAAEKIPIQKMEGRKSEFAAKKKLVGELTKLVEELQLMLDKNSSAINFKEMKVHADSDSVGITVDKTIAHRGNHQLEVTQLAQKSSAMSSGFEDPEKSYIGVGYIQYDLPDGETKDLYIDSENSSLKGIAKLINDDEGNGMSANVVNDGSGTDTPWRLILALDETGDDKIADFPYFYFVDGEDDLYIEFEREAQDAKIKLDGFEVEIPKNSTSDLIPGLTIDLKKARPGEEFTVGVTEDSEAVEKKVVGFIDSVNSVFQFISNQNKLDEHSNTRETLGGDITLQTIESRLRSSIMAPVMTTKGTRRLSELGIMFTRKGILATDQNKFNSAIKRDFSIATEVFTGAFLPDGSHSDGIINRLRSFTNSVLRFPSGILRNSAKSLKAKMSSMDKRIADRQRIIDQKEKMMKDKFARLEGTINKIKGSGAGLAAMGAASSNPVQQLG